MKFFRNTSPLWAILLLFAFQDCKPKDSIFSCSDNAQKMGDAATKYANDPTVANCEAYKKTVIDFVKSCPTYYSGTQKEDLEEFANTACQ